MEGCGLACLFDWRPVLEMFLKETGVRGGVFDTATVIREEKLLRPKLKEDDELRLLRKQNVEDDVGDRVGLTIVLPSLSLLELSFQPPRSMVDLGDFRCCDQVFVVPMFSWHAGFEVCSTLLSLHMWPVVWYITDLL